MDGRTKWEYESWGEGEPKSKDDQEIAIAINFKKLGYWEDQERKSKNSFICQFHMTGLYFLQSVIWFDLV